MIAEKPQISDIRYQNYHLTVPPKRNREKNLIITAIILLIISSPFLYFVLPPQALIIYFPLWKHLHASQTKKRMIPNIQAITFQLPAIFMLTTKITKIATKTAVILTIRMPKKLQKLFFLSISFLLLLIMILLYFYFLSYFKVLKKYNYFFKVNHIISYRFCQVLRKSERKKKRLS